MARRARGGHFCLGGFLGCFWSDMSMQVAVLLLQSDVTWPEEGSPKSCSGGWRGRRLLRAQGSTHHPCLATAKGLELALKAVRHPAFLGSFWVHLAPLKPFFKSCNTTLRYHPGHESCALDARVPLCGSAAPPFSTGFYVRSWPSEP